MGTKSSIELSSAWLDAKAADVGKMKPKEALDETARTWDRITRRMNARSQKVQWAFLKTLYPADVRAALT